MTHDGKRGDFWRGHGDSPTRGGCGPLFLVVVLASGIGIVNVAGILVDGLVSSSALALAFGVPTGLGAMLLAAVGVGGWLYRRRLTPTPDAESMLVKIVDEYREAILATANVSARREKSDGVQAVHIQEAANQDRRNSADRRTGRTSWVSTTCMTLGGAFIGGALKSAQNFFDQDQVETRSAVWVMVIGAVGLASLLGGIIAQRARDA